jgi:thiol:disulfide interchange protein DsbD
VLEKMLSITVLLLVISACASGQTPVRWSLATGSPVSAWKAGAKINVLITAQIDPGWHIYSITQPVGGPIRTQITVHRGSRFKRIGPVIGPKPRRKLDDSFGMNVESYEGIANFRFPVLLSSEAPVGLRKLTVAVRFQACNGEKCLPVKTVKLTLDVNIVRK